jgi:hypothetical protein
MSVYLLLGEYDSALEQLEYLLSIPSLNSVHLTRIDPRWDAVRDRPRYKALTASVPAPPDR